MAVRVPLLDRALAKVKYDHGCWLFTGAKVNGYGVVNRGGRASTILVHRAVYEHLVGPIPHRHDLDHLCRTPACCNPLHLEPVTHAENMRRGIGGLVKRAITHCPKGHEYTPENTRLKQPGDRRECRECGRIYERNKMRALRAQRSAA
jgi:hypothetical protein